MTKQILITALLAVLLSACNASTPAVVTPQAETPLPAIWTPTPITPSATAVPPTSEVAPIPTYTPEPVRYGPDNYPANVNPLTGKVVSDPTILNRRPLAMKIQLFPRLYRPPLGLSKADVVFDYYQNNGLTRLHAIFYGTDVEKAGPVRSARLFDDHLIRMFKSVFAFGGADERIQTRLFSGEYANRLLVEGPQNCPGLCREDPTGENFLVANTADMTTWAVAKKVDDNTKQDLNGFVFDEVVPANGQPAIQITNHFSISAYSRWDYNAESGLYLRSQDTQETNEGNGEAFAPLVDRVNNEQISTANVVVLLIAHDYFYRSKSGDSEIIDILWTGTGKGYAYRDGKEFEIQWSRPTAAGLVSLTLADGTAYALKPGTTWFEIMGTSTTMQNQESGAWRFDFSIP